MATKTNSTNFDFAAYYAAIKSANSGLRLFLAEQMLQDVQAVMLRFRSPLVKDITKLIDQVELLREANKDYLAKRNPATGQNAYTTPDEPTAPAHSTSADGGKVA
jgi:hypothetical protein